MLSISILSVCLTVPDGLKQKKVFRCGSSYHLANAKNGPAVSVTCHVGEKGHFEKVCKSMTKEVQELLFCSYKSSCAVTRVPYLFLTRFVVKSR